MHTNCCLDGLKLPERFFEPVYLEEESLKKLAILDPEVSKLNLDLNSEFAAKIYLTDSGLILLIYLEKGFFLRLYSERKVCVSFDVSSGVLSIRMDGKMVELKKEIDKKFKFCDNSVLQMIASFFEIMPFEICEICTSISPQRSCLSQQPF
ncbi:MAG: hypothetical protein QXE86_04010 [Archaeoglobaceae archaeon]